jgi:hypothetical protein
MGGASRSTPCPPPVLLDHVRINDDVGRCRPVPDARPMERGLRLAQGATARLSAPGSVCLGCPVTASVFRPGIAALVAVDVAKIPVLVREDGETAASAVHLAGSDTFSPTPALCLMR